MPTNFTVYILQSDDLQHFYIGVSSHVLTRLEQHNAGSSRSTKPYRPWHIVYTENFESKEKAYKREFFLKSPAGYLEKKRILATISKSKFGEIA